MRSQSFTTRTSFLTAAPTQRSEASRREWPLVLDVRLRQSLIVTSKYQFLILTLVLQACESAKPRHDVVYGLADNELNRLGALFGYQVEALGMSNYNFRKGRHEFDVWAHRDHSVPYVKTRTPVRLAYGSAMEPVVEAEVEISHGVPFAVVEKGFREFIQQIEHLHRK